MKSDDDDDGDGGGDGDGDDVVVDDDEAFTAVRWIKYRVHRATAL